MEEELTYPRYNEAGNLIEGPPAIQSEEEEVLEEDGVTSMPHKPHSLRWHRLYCSPRLCKCSERGDYITPQDAKDFYEQAQRLPRLRINECMQRQAIDLLHVKIMTVWP